MTGETGAAYASTPGDDAAARGAAAAARAAAYAVNKGSGPGSGSGSPNNARAKGGSGGGGGGGGRSSTYRKLTPAEAIKMREERDARAAAEAAAAQEADGMTAEERAAAQEAEKEERRVRIIAEHQARAEREERNRREAEEKARAEAEERAKRDAEERAKTEAAKRVKAEFKAKADAEAKAKAAERDAERRNWADHYNSDEDEDLPALPFAPAKPAKVGKSPKASLKASPKASPKGGPAAGDRLAAVKGNQLPAATETACGEQRAASAKSAWGPREGVAPLARGAMQALATARGVTRGDPFPSAKGRKGTRGEVAEGSRGAGKGGRGKSDARLDGRGGASWSDSSGLSHGGGAAASPSAEAFGCVLSRSSKRLEALAGALREGAPIDATMHGGMYDGYTLLHAAAFNGHEAHVQLLLARGASCSATNRTGATALTLAAKKGHVAVARLLLQAGANPEAVTSENTEIAALLRKPPTKSAISEPRIGPLPPESVSVTMSRSGERSVVLRGMGGKGKGRGTGRDRKSGEREDRKSGGVDGGAEQISITVGQNSGERGVRHHRGGRGGGERGGGGLHSAREKCPW